MTEYVQLVGTDTPGATGSCCLVTDERRCLFNCPEGSQRAMAEGRLRLGKVSTFFFTRVDVSSIMGLPGFLFSINDCGTKHCIIAGPLRELRQFLETTWRCFFGYSRFACELLNYMLPQDLDSSVPRGRARIEGGFKRSLGGAPPSHADAVKGATFANVTCAPEAYHAVLGTTLFDEKMGLVHIIGFHAGFTQPSSSPLGVLQRSAMVGYILLERGKTVFDVVKAKSLGVKPGPKYTMLKRGTDVMNDAEPPVLVAASEVVTHHTGAVFSLVLDTEDPSELAAALRTVLASPLLVGFTLQHIIHLTPPKVASSLPYQETIASTAWWQQAFPNIAVSPDMMHIASYKQQRFSGFPTALVHRLHLAALAPQFFPLPDNEGQCSQGPCDEPWPYAIKYHIGAHRVPPATSTSVPRHPHILEDSCVQYPNMPLALGLLSDAFRDQYLVAKGATAADERIDAVGLSNNSGRMTFLGTGSSIPSKYRNVSGILVELPLDSSREPTEQVGAPSDPMAPAMKEHVVFDCGEGTVGQLYAMCCHPMQAAPSAGTDIDAPMGERGARVFQETVATIRLVFISHSHADHNLGVFALLQHIAEARDCLRQHHATLPGAIGRSSQRAARGITLVAPLDFMEFVHGTGLLNMDVLAAQYGLNIDTFVHRGPMEARCPVRLRQNNAVTTFAASAAPRTPHIASPGLEGDMSFSSQDATVPPSFPHFFRWCEASGFIGDVFPVDHPAHAHGIVIRKKEDGLLPSPTMLDAPAAVAGKGPTFGVLYSGDTRPNELLVLRGRQFGPLTALIHEATFDDSIREEAIAKRHSTTGEAIEVARRCCARNCVLTHFSQRYPKLPPPSATAGPPLIHDGTAASWPRVVFSFDYMSIPFDDEGIQRLTEHAPAFSALLVEYESWETGTSKRLRES